ncbi:unnamed protein product [Prorocentrum cordatum]|nr:unnamed protein product [Polarella glacialis]
MMLAVPSVCAATLLEAHLSTEVGDAQPASACRCPALAGVLTPARVRALERDGFLVLEGRDAPLGPGVVSQARGDAVAAMQQGRFARTSNDSDVRQDMVCWIRETDGTPDAVDDTHRRVRRLGDGLLECVRLLRGVAQALETSGYGTPLGECLHVPQQLQLAWYPADGTSRYVRHLDACVDSALDLGLLEWLRTRDYRERAVTAILYLNASDWCADRGGALRLHHPEFQRDSASPDGPSPGAHFDVLPRGGTLVLFDSRRVEHQVLPTNEDRFALTLWIIGRAKPEIGSRWTWFASSEPLQK